MMLVDVHAHLDHFDDNEIARVIKNAELNNVKVIISNGTDPRTNRKVLQLAKDYKIVKPALGLYPTNALEMSMPQIEEELEFIKKNKAKIVAIGEVGLDYYWKQDKNKEQKEIFSKIIELTEQVKLPIIVHSRKAEFDVIEMLESSSIKNKIIHCFGGKLSLAKQCRDYGWNFSIPTNVARSVHFQRIIEEFPINQLLTETDSPYLGPVANERNEPMNVIETVKKIAQIKGLDVEECSKILFMNYQKIF